MTPSEVLREARERGIELSINGDKLKLRAPEGALDAALHDALTAHKPAILEILRGPPVGLDGLPAGCCTCGSPSWWDDRVYGRWRCSHCDSRPEAFVGRSCVVNEGHWGKH